MTDLGTNSTKWLILQLFFAHFGFATFVPQYGWYIYSALTNNRYTFLILAIQVPVTDMYNVFLPTKMQIATAFKKMNMYHRDLLIMRLIQDMYE